MEPGDLVIFKPQGKMKSGSLTSVKYFERINKKIQGCLGIIIEDHGYNCSVMFGDKLLIIHKLWMEKYNG